MPKPFSYNFEPVFEKLKFGFGWASEILTIFIDKKLGLIFFVCFQMIPHILFPTEEDLENEGYLYSACSNPTHVA
jgi:hypothetical protein